jgi:hypothetical protein
MMFGDCNGYGNSNCDRNGASITMPTQMPSTIADTDLMVVCFVCVLC